jgi:hypothetical protein
MPFRVVIRLRDGLGLVQFLSTAVPRLAAEISRIEVIQMRDEVTVEHFPLKDWDDVVAPRRGWCRMRVIACGQAELFPYQCGALGLSLNRSHDLMPWHGLYLLALRDGATKEGLPITPTGQSVVRP